MQFLIDISGSASPDKTLLLSSLSVYYASNNGKGFSVYSEDMFSKLMSCFMDVSSDLINSLHKYSVDRNNLTIFQQTTSSYLSILTLSSSNLLNIVEKNVGSDGIVTLKNFQQTTMLRNLTNIKAKETLEKNAELLMLYSPTQKIKFSSENFLFISNSSNYNKL